MNEVVVDGVNGLLVPGVPDGRAPRSGIPAFAPDVKALTAAIERIADDELRAELAAGARRRREELSWENTTADLEELIAAAEAIRMRERILRREQILDVPIERGVRVLLAGREPRGDHPAAAPLPDHHPDADRRCARAR